MVWKFELWSGYGDQNSENTGKFILDIYKKNFPLKDDNIKRFFFFFYKSQDLIFETSKGFKFHYNLKIDKKIIKKI